ncbi:lipoprotein [Mesoplasma corruscae]|uniref:Lipoprotein n=1 Tax=Mesoplasma corruscae TaxID=216874 RepID=A0A2S5RG59_9MOLU|nr:lipoprotein [Mesoplasma corruscae]PPE06278.1 hypothetical protein MCORR_v1c05830 [Mesoplasma corruscae]
MKKLLIILGALTLTATPSLVVVSCSNNVAETVNQFIELADGTRPTFKGVNEIDKKGSTLVYYIGGADNYSSLSFEYALKQATNTENLTDAFAVLNNGTDASTGPVKAFKDLGKLTSLGNDAGIQEVSTKWNKSNSRHEFINKTENVIFSKEALGTDIKIAGYQASSIDNLWTSKVTKKILSDWLTPSIARMTYDITLETNNQKLAEANTKTKKNELFDGAQTLIETKVKELSESKGPIFLIIRNGELIGYLNGYTVYNEVDKVILQKDQDAFKNKGRSYDSKDIENMFKTWNETLAFSNVESNNKSILQDIYKKEGTSKFSFNDSGLEPYKKLIDKWDEGVLNRIPD